MRKLTQEEFVKRSISIFGDKYDYSTIRYKNSRTRVKIICKEHGVFEQYPNILLFRKTGCPKCGNKIKGKYLKKTTEQFIQEANQVHNNKYDYSLVEYVNNHTKVKIICKEHGIFEQAPVEHLQGGGCPFHKISIGENKIADILLKNNIKYERQKRFKECKDILPLPFDFYLPDYNMCIEFQGIQHIKPIYGYITFGATLIHDEIKEEYCLTNNIKLAKIWYDEDIKNRLKEEINDMFD